MTQAPGTWITTTEAAQRLGVKRATLYAYVSRGLLRSERRPGQQESLFDRAQIDAMASATRPPGGPQPVLRFRSIATAVSSQVEGDLLYRGHPLHEVVALGSLEDAAAIVLDTPVAAAVPSPTLATVGTVDLGSLPVERRMPVAVQLLAAADPFASDTDPHRVRAAAVPTLRAAVALAGGVALAPARSTGSGGSSGDRTPAGGSDPGRAPDLATLALAALGGSPARASAGDVAVLRVLLVALLDHGLTASTVAARVSASTRAGLHDCLSAAYAAMAGPLHGAAPVAAHPLLTEGVDPEVLVARSLRERGGVAGFGHFLYPDGDPRAEVVLEALWRRRGTTRLRRRVERLVAIVSDRTGALPNIDLASAAVLHALGLPAGAGEVAFQVARSIGVAAHVAEEYAEEPLRWRGRDPTG
ncbi:citrate synthase [Terrabacter aerolatus]|uniref:citrate synthase (unknown stereospecificity) n=1 Tax=Terrabacter aerolatus TaxID=422442 RepID=A0A512D6G2_9MICO|nr:citrate synthase [Terrabacter aerolatus]GEO32063.1 citrate synthase [Terrabacter aerolatus]